jgi:hypothetical protein
MVEYQGRKDDAASPMTVDAVLVKFGAGRQQSPAVA